MRPVPGKTGVRAGKLVASLGDICLPDLVQAVANSGKTAVIAITHGGMVSRLWLSGGELIDAESGNLRGEPAAYRVLSLQCGELVTDFQEIMRGRRIFSSIQSLMLQVAFRKDECAALRRYLVAAGDIYCRTSTRPNSVTDADQVLADTLRLVDSSRSLDEILLLGSYGDLEMLRAMADLLHKGHIQAVSASSKSALRTNLRPRRAPKLQEFGPSASDLSAPMSAQIETATRSSEADVAWASPVTERGLLAKHRQHNNPLPAAIEKHVSVDRFGLSLTPSSDRKTQRLILAALSFLGFSVAGIFVVSWLTTTQKVPFLEVVVEPSRAQIWLDGERVGTGAARLRLQTGGGPRELRLSAPGYVTQTWRVDKALPPKRVVLRLQQPVPVAFETSRRETSLGPALAPPFQATGTWDTVSPANAGAAKEAPSARPLLLEPPETAGVRRLLPVKSRSRTQTAKVPPLDPETSRLAAADAAASGKRPARGVSDELSPAVDALNHEHAGVDREAQLQMNIIEYQRPAVRLLD